MEDVLPRGSLDLHRRTAPAPLDAPVGTLQHQLPGVEELELLWVRTYVFSNSYSNFWLIFGKLFERPVLGCIDAKFCK